MKKTATITSAIAFFTVLFASCKASENRITEEKIDNKGNLVLVANGEDFVRQGFLAKDGWQIEFDRLEVSVSEVIAYEMDSDPKANFEKNLKSQPQVLIVAQAKTIDLAAGDDNAQPIVVSNTEAPEAFYNALSWKMQPTEDGLLPDQTIVLQGKAVKAQRNVNFILGFRVPLTYFCGEFVGEERKGMLQSGKSAEVEMTFHFDHIFGDGALASEDSINQTALGFQPLADVAQGDNLKLDWQGLQENLSPEDYALLKDAIRQSLALRDRGIRSCGRRTLFS